MAPPLLSVIIPAYNGAAFLVEAIESIWQQNYQPLEIIIVDDGSTDETARIANNLKSEGRSVIRYVSQVHTGKPAPGRNRGLKEAKGKIIGFLDQDDLWPADKLALQLPQLLNNPSLDVILGHSQMLQLRGVVDGKHEFEAVGNPVDYTLLSSGLFKRTAFEKVGCFDESLKYFGDDLDWVMRAKEQGVPVRQMAEVTLYWRIHDTNTSHDPSIRDHAHGYDRALTEVIKKSLERRRKR
jgi:glycosyltransferase involved in cell wall biosynthesis